MDAPDILIEGLPYRSSTFPVPNQNNGHLTITREDDKKPLDELLRSKQFQDTFWPFQHLLQILSRDRVLNELKKYDNLKNPEMYVDYIRPENDPLLERTTPTYLRIFALLVLCEKGNEIDKFWNEGISDQKLPVCRHEASEKGKIYLCSKYMPNQLLNSFKEWKKHERQWFETTQWQLLVKFFKLGPDNKAEHYDLDDNAILPWKRNDTRSLISSHPLRLDQKNDGSLLSSRTAQSGVLHEGGFANVSCVRIDPSSHGFSEVLEDTIHLNHNLFALKELHETDHNNKEKFQQETELLQRFNGLVNRHLVTLLATFTFQKRYYFLFPYAEYALDEYWTEKEPNPKMDIGTVRWVSKQCAGIMAGISTIHEPPSESLKGLDVQKFGRHGDIKPDNILWFSTSSDPKGILVISDMGLSTLNREKSRSGLARYNIPRVPGYSPPECDIRGGKISRAYDIWTLGCLFLELLTWLLGGSALREEFERARTTEYLLTGAKNKIFFSLVKHSEGSSRLTAQVKDEVSQWFQKLHNNEKCSQFIHDALEIIEKEMLLVHPHTRSLSVPLKKKFGDLFSKCMDSSNVDYCTKGDPRCGPVRYGTGFIVIPSENAQAKINGNS